MGQVDKELVKELTAAKHRATSPSSTRPKGKALVMSKKKIGGTVVKEKQKECGGGQVIRGLCSLEDGTLVFKTVANVSDGMTKKLREAIKDGGGPPLKVEMRTVETVEEIDDAGEDVSEEETNRGQSVSERVQSISKLYDGWVSRRVGLEAEAAREPRGGGGAGRRPGLYRARGDRKPEGTGGPQLRRGEHARAEARPLPRRRRHAPEPRDPRGGQGQGGAEGGDGPRGPA